MISAMCQLAGEDVPVYVGAQEPLLIDQRQSEAPQSAALPLTGPDREYPHGEAISFMRRTIRQNPGEVVLLTIGPLTNIALLFKVDPEIPYLLKGLVMMCGAFEVDRIEWNAMLDPHASAVVYNTHTPLHRSVGLDVTTQVTMSAEEVRSRFQAPLLRLVLDFAEIWFQDRDVITFHDPLAAATIFEDGICQFKRGQVAVELDDQETLGKTHWKPMPNGRHEVATRVNPERFLGHFFSLFT
jgi:inosine-uridine nucleoside N-ribohydrolase